MPVSEVRRPPEPRPEGEGFCVLWCTVLGVDLPALPTHGPSSRPQWETTLLPVIPGGPITPTLQTEAGTCLPVHRTRCWCWVAATRGSLAPWSTQQTVPQADNNNFSQNREPQMTSTSPRGRGWDSRTFPWLCSISLETIFQNVTLQYSGRLMG